MMRDTISELQMIVDDCSATLRTIQDVVFAEKPDPQKWSKKEVLGHLIDSAQNNLRRFITAQYEITPPTITYQQDFWVAANDYQSMAAEELILLWKLINQRIISILKNMPHEQYNKICNTGSPRTLEWLAADYVRHTKHHLNQIFPGSFNIQYS